MFHELTWVSGWAGEHGVVRITKDFILYPLPLATGALEPMSIPREPQLNIDTEYLKARNSQVLERRKQKPQEEEENIFEEPEEELAPDVELAEEEEELEEEILPAITAAGKIYSLNVRDQVFLSRYEAP